MSEYPFCEYCAPDSSCLKCERYLASMDKGVHRCCIGETQVFAEYIDVVLEKHRFSQSTSMLY